MILPDSAAICRWSSIQWESVGVHGRIAYKKKHVFCEQQNFWSVNLKYGTLLLRVARNTSKLECRPVGAMAQHQRPEFDSFDGADRWTGRAMSGGGVGRFFPAPRTTPLLSSIFTYGTLRVSNIWIFLQQRTAVVNVIHVTRSQWISGRLIFDVFVCLY